MRGNLSDTAGLLLACSLPFIHNKETLKEVPAKAFTLPAQGHVGQRLGFTDIFNVITEKNKWTYATFTLQELFLNSDVLLRSDFLFGCSHKSFLNVANIR